jgi:hypothetical protein
MKRKGEKAMKKAEKERRKQKENSDLKGEQPDEITDALPQDALPHFNMRHEEVVLYLSRNTKWPLRLTFVCPPPSCTYTMLVTGRQRVLREDTDELAGMRSPSVKRSPSDAAAAAAAVAAAADAGVEEGYEEGVECKVVIDKGSVKINPTGAATKPLLLELVGSTLLEFVMQPPPLDPVMSGVRVKGKWGGERETEFDFKFIGELHEKAHEDEEDEQLIHCTSVFKRAVDHANADLDWDDVLGYEEQQGDVVDSKHDDFLN